MASDELTGREAFEMTLGRLVEESRESHVQREKLGDAQGEIRTLTKNLDQARHANAMLNDSLKDRASENKKLEAFGGAAQAVLDALRGIGTPIEGLPVALVDNLRETLKIPF